MTIERTMMPVMKIAKGEIYYEEFGRGFPVLCFAPGSLRSQIDYWHHSPRDPSKPSPAMDPTADLADHFRVIAVDQRNAGRSRAPVRPTRCSITWVSRAVTPSGPASGRASASNSAR
jgi:pimeloyl-ACP methyl ester carboxylesterase